MKIAIVAALVLALTAQAYAGSMLLLGSGKPGTAAPPPATCAGSVLVNTGSSLLTNTGSKLLISSCYILANTGSKILVNTGSGLLAQ